MGDAVKHPQFFYSRYHIEVLMYTYWESMNPKC